MSDESAPAKSQKSAYLTAALLGGSGVLHFAMPGPFDTIVPHSLPGEARQWTYLSGVAELAIAGGLLMPRTRKPAALAAVGLLLAVFPANIQMTVDWMSDPRKSKALKAGSIARLPLQIPMITTAMKAYRNAA
ncbi:MAG: hypothetical protein LLG14_17115 [Nocardiaceae bacterium]|nr:hypothetical protein [Nocardiaceae bacterium]